MTLDEYKNKIISNVMKEMEDNCKYRWSDVFDYICENWDLDNEWETLFEMVASSYQFKDFEELFKSSQNVNITKYSKFISEYLLSRFYSDLKSKI